MYSNKRKLLNKILLLILNITLAGNLIAEEPKQMFRISADKTIRKLKDGVDQAFGNVVLSQKDTWISADYVEIQYKESSIYAKGNVIITLPDQTLTGSEVWLDYKNQTGRLKDASVITSKYVLNGSEIFKLGPKHYLTEYGEYTTCKDCPKSWTMMGKKIDLQTGEYAYLKEVYFKINDTPAIYLPYVVVPIKTKRQSGLLFPKFAYSETDGFRILAPYFWAISEHQDATVALGTLTNRGPRLDTEYRYKLTPRSGGQFNFNFLNDSQYQQGLNSNNGKNKVSRWSGNYDHTIELPQSIENKVRLREVSDNDFSKQFVGVTTEDPSVESNFQFTKSTEDFILALEANRFRNRLYNNPKGFDPNTIQVFPSVSLLAKEKRLMDAIPIYYSGEANLSNFTRKNDEYDPSTLPLLAGTTAVDSKNIPIRKATRLWLEPSLSLPLSIGDYLNVTPRATFKQVKYFFQKDTRISETIPNASKNYLLLQVKNTTSLENIYSFDGTYVKKFKHVVRPEVTYSIIPEYYERAAHRFNKQVTEKNQVFDVHDIIPYKTSPYTLNPLGHSINFKLLNRLIGKYQSDLDAEAIYNEPLTIANNLTLDLLELQKPAHDPNPANERNLFSPLETIATLNFNDVSLSLTHNYFFKIPDKMGSHHTLSGSTAFNFKPWPTGSGSRLSLSYTVDARNHDAPTKNFGYTANIVANENLSFFISRNIDLAAKESNIISSSYGGIYSSPSKCWMLGLSTTQVRDDKGAVNNEFAFDFKVNITGDGYVGMGDFSKVGGG